VIQGTKGAVLVAEGGHDLFQVQVDELLSLFRGEGSGFEQGHEYGSRGVQRGPGVRPARGGDQGRRGRSEDPGIRILTSQDQARQPQEDGNQKKRVLH